MLTLAIDAAANANAFSCNCTVYKTFDVDGVDIVESLSLLPEEMIIPTSILYLYLIIYFISNDSSIYITSEMISSSRTYLLYNITRGVLCY